MSAATARRSDPLSFDLESSAAFAAVAGTYVAALLLPFVLAVVPGRGAPAARQYAAVLVGGPSLALLAWLPLRAAGDRLAERLGGSSARWLLAAPPLGHLLLALRSAVPLGAAAVAAVVGALSGIVVAAMAGNRYVRARYGGSPVLASFTAGWAPRRRRLVVAGAGLWLVGWTAAFLAGSLTTGTTPYPLQVLATLGVPLVGASAERDYQVTPDGLVRRTPATVTVVPWERFEAFAFADDALALDRRFRTTKLDREAVDEAAVRAALSEHLPERDG